MKDFAGTLLEVAADVGGHALNVDVKTQDGTVVQGWISIAPQIAREAIAVALTALSSRCRISVRMDPGDRVATAVRVIAR